MVPLTSVAEGIIELEVAVAFCMTANGLTVALTIVLLELVGADELSDEANEEDEMIEDDVVEGAT